LILAILGYVAGLFLEDGEILDALLGVGFRLVLIRRILVGFRVKIVKLVNLALEPRGATGLVDLAVAGYELAQGARLRVVAFALAVLASGAALLGLAAVVSLADGLGHVVSEIMVGDVGLEVEPLSAVVVQAGLAAAASGFPARIRGRAHHVFVFHELGEVLD